MIENNKISFNKADILLALQFISDLGDQITASLLALCVLDISKSTDKIGFIYFFSTLGFVIFTMVGGVLGDRYSKKRTLILSDFSRGIAVLLMIYALHEKSLVIIYVTSFILSMLGALHRPVKLSVWTTITSNNSLQRYNSLSELSLQISMAIGPLIASFFVVRAWTNIGFSFDVLTFFLCSATFALVISDEKKTFHEPCKQENDLLRGFRLIAHHPKMSRYVACAALQMIGFGAFNATFLVLAQRDFGWSKIDYSYHLTIMALTAIAGALLGASRWIEQVNPITLFINSALISALSLWGILYYETFPIGSILFGICNGMVVVTATISRTKIQLFAKQLHPESLSSILASRSIVIKIATLVGTGACLLIDDLISLEITLFLFVIPIVISFVPFLFGIRYKNFA